ncbi:(S)-norcoclaurine synthase protein [Dioscorea alata]|uniref:(S)-norcoclaurine synthase protein n=1 Tax=Dioscorea alata TaxID=55571 RepID=A0ACB7WHG6_DIOAL|nr:(S)-norcoclaurine synthase protein [Dioscorea alata]
MKGEVVHELEICLSAEEIWMIYRTLQLSELVVKLLPNIIHKVEVVEGDGGVGTVIIVHFSSEMSPVQSLKEKFTKIDDEKRIKEAHIIEGGYLQLGFISYMNRLEIIKKEDAVSVMQFRL